MARPIPQQFDFFPTQGEEGNRNPANPSQALTVIPGSLQMKEEEELDEKRAVSPCTGAGSSGIRPRELSKVSSSSLSTLLNTGRYMAACDKSPIYSLWMSLSTVW